MGIFVLLYVIYHVSRLWIGLSRTIILHCGIFGEFRRIRLYEETKNRRFICKKGNLPSFKPVSMALGSFFLPSRPPGSSRYSTRWVPSVQFSYNFVHFNSLEKKKIAVIVGYFSFEKRRQKIRWKLSALRPLSNLYFISSKLPKNCLKT